jgi:hypothetical protein
MGLKEVCGGYKAMSGYYVVNISDSWVYDVDIYLAGKDEKIAVVGFTPQQLDGALFWQVSYEDILDGNYNSADILDIARKYRDMNRPRALCE